MSPQLEYNLFLFFLGLSIPFAFWLVRYLNEGEPCHMCKKRPIYSKKYGLCKACYERLRRRGELTEVKTQVTTPTTTQTAGSVV